MPEEAANTQSPKKRIVFVVEDDVFLLRAYQIKFQKIGAELWSASDGKEALAYLSKDPPNVVLLDLFLPGVSGFEVLAEIRKNERWKNVPVFVLSNLSQPQDIERAKALGIDEYLVKANTKIGDIAEKASKYL